MSSMKLALSMEICVSQTSFFCKRCNWLTSIGGGKDGEVTFPYNVLTPELGAPDDGFLDRIITKDHDKRCLEKVLEWVRGLGENFERSEQGMEM